MNSTIPRRERTTGMISTIVLAVVFLGESITAIKVIGDAVILAAVLVTVRSKG